MRYLLLIATALISAAGAAVTGEWQVNLVRGATTIQPASTGATQEAAWQACLARIPRSSPAAATYKCQTPRYVATTTPDPAPTCPSPPASTARMQACPPGTTGTWQQKSTSTTGPPPACAVTTTWTPSSPPAGACAPDPKPPAAGTIRNGEAFTVTGSGFGSKPVAAPLVFDDFEAGTGKVEGQKALSGTWGRGDWSGAVTYDPTQPLQGAQVARHAFGGGNYNASLYADRASATYYLDYWMRLVPRGSYTRNFKPWRIYAAGDRSWANDVVFCDSPGWVGTDWGPGGWVQQPGKARPFGQWEHYRVVVRSGLVFSQHRNGVADREQSVTAVTGNAEGVRIGHYWALDGDANCGPNPGADVYTDLVYVDTSLARVYLADAPKLASAKHTAIQLPTAWSDAAVTFTGNTHGFQKGATAHLIVIDAANVEREAQTVVVD